MERSGNSEIVSPITFTVSAPGKLILFGEHSVVYGKSALAASINKRTYLKLTEADNEMFRLNMKEINFDYSFLFKYINKIINEDIPDNNMKILTNPIVDVNEINHDEFVSIVEENIKKLIGDNLTNINKEQKSSLIVFFYLLHGIYYKDLHSITEPGISILSPLSIDITTELSIGSGTGSSAAFCVCIAAALIHYKNIKKYGLISAEKITFSEEGLKSISKWAFKGETVMHGKPSGIDNTVATFGSFIEVTNMVDISTNITVKQFLKLDHPPVINIILINTGVLRNTAELVNKVVKLKSNNPAIVNHIFNAMHEVSEKGCQIVKDMGNGQGKTSNPSDFKLLEELIDINQGLLYSLGASHPRLQDLCLICSDYGLHAKLTGAGGGGYAFTLVPPNFDKDILTNCLKKLQKNGYIISDIKLGDDGVRLEKK